MTHEITIKINGTRIRFSFCTQAYYNLTQKYGCDLSGVFQRAQSDYLAYYRDIVYEAAAVCKENDLSKLPENVFEWFDMMDPKEVEQLSKAHENSRILGKSIRGN